MIIIGSDTPKNQQWLQHYDATYRVDVNSSTTVSVSSESET
jgi:hypothetical protein